ncbi:MAG: hypothetical protein HW410_1139 [Nitrosarchaeum sp.]|nr:hypothetical protein [Nitrosarchaeum sp.]
MTLQRTKTIRSLILICVGVSCIGIIFGFTGNSCVIQHIAIMNDLKIYEETLNPEFCDDMVEKINLFNDDCQPQVEILDCG